MHHLLTSVLLLLACTTAAAKHAQCYWTGPGVGTPEQQGFSVFGTGNMRKYSNLTYAVVEYVCDEYEDKPVVADWNVLKPSILELASPCAHGGYSGDCSYGLWSFKLNGYTDRTGELSPVRYMRKTDDCEWIDPIEESNLPSSITIYHK